MGYNAYIVKCQFRHPGIQTFTMTGTIVKETEKSKFTKVRVEECARKMFTEALQNSLDQVGRRINAEDFKMTITLKGVSNCFIESI